MKPYQVPPVHEKMRRPIIYWTANIIRRTDIGDVLHEIDRHESKPILTARHGHYNIVYKSWR